MSEPEYRLTGKMLLFANEWLTGAATGKRMNGRAAYEHAGYTISVSNPSANASKLLRHPSVAEYIKKQMDDFSMTPQEVLVRFTEIARSEVGDVVRLDEATKRLILDTDAVIENKRFITKFGHDSNGSPKVEFQDPAVALRDIMRIHGMAKDGLEIGGPSGAPLTLTVSFVDPAGEDVKLGPTDAVVAVAEDFSEFDEG